MLSWLCIVAGAFLSSCTPAAASESAEEAFKAPPAVVQTAILEEITLSQRRDGTANILAPGDLVDLDAEIRNAKIALEFTTVQFGRFQKTPTLPRLTVENSERQLKTDQSNLDRLRARLAHTWGEDAPVIDDAHRNGIVQALAAGTKALARIDFAGGLDGTPENVEVKPLGGRSPVKVETIWQAPSGNQAMPGASYFALISQSAGLRPGDRATATAETGTLKGLVIPSASIVVTESASWCYVETKPGDYTRKAVSLTTPVDKGYLVTQGFEPGMKVVISGASTLLAREADPSSGGDDDDDGPKRPAAKPKAPQPEAVSEKTASPPAKDTDDDDKPSASKPATEEAKPSKPAHAAADSDDALTTGATPVDRN